MEIYHQYFLLSQWICQLRGCKRKYRVIYNSLIMWSNIRLTWAVDILIFQLRCIRYSDRCSNLVPPHIPSAATFSHHWKYINNNKYKHTYINYILYGHKTFLDLTFDAHCTYINYNTTRTSSYDVLVQHVTMSDMSLYGTMVGRSP